MAREEGPAAFEDSYILLFFWILIILGNFANYGMGDGWLPLRLCSACPHLLCSTKQWMLRDENHSSHLMAGLKFPPKKLN